MKREIMCLRRREDVGTGGIIGRADDKHSGKIAGHVAEIRSMPSQNDCELTQNEVMAGLTPGQGFRYAGAEKVDLL